MNINRVCSNRSHVLLSIDGSLSTRTATHQSHFGDDSMVQATGIGTIIIIIMEMNLLYTKPLRCTLTSVLFGSNLKKNLFSPHKATQSGVIVTSDYSLCEI
jgi:hypothetical protein